jgi:hypothetical protein
MKTLADIAYDPTTGVFTYAGIPHGTVNRSGYVVMRGDSKVLYGHRIAWFKTYGVWPVMIDHINGNRTDNCIANLREVTAAQNIQNTVHGKGTHYHKPSKSWKSAICINHRQIHLGYFPDAASAAECYQFAKEFFHQPRRSYHA